MFTCVPVCLCAPVCTWELGLIDRMARSPLFGARHRSRESGVRRLQVRAARCLRVTPELFWRWKTHRSIFLAEKTHRSYFGAEQKSSELFWSRKNASGVAKIAPSWHQARNSIVCKFDRKRKEDYMWVGLIEFVFVFLQLYFHRGQKIRCEWVSESDCLVAPQVNQLYECVVTFLTG